VITKIIIQPAVNDPLYVLNIEAIPDFGIILFIEKDVFGLLDCEYEPRRGIGKDLDKSQYKTEKKTKDLQHIDTLPQPVNIRSTIPSSPTKRPDDRIS
jgi:hypothetical protein